MDSNDHFKAVKLALHKAQEELERIEALEKKHKERGFQGKRAQECSKRQIQLGQTSTKVTTQIDSTNKQPVLAALETAFRDELASWKSLTGRLEKRPRIEEDPPLVSLVRTVRMKTLSHKEVAGGKGKGVFVTLPLEASVRSRQNVPNFITTATKQYHPEHAKEFEKVKSSILYEEAATNCFRVTDFILQYLFL